MGRLKGDRRERELVTELNGAGWCVIRVPSSGSGTDRELPDLIAGNSDVIVVGEAKTSQTGEIVYVDAVKVSGIEYVADMFDAYPVVLMRWDGDTTWYWQHLSEIPMTPSRNLSVKDYEVQGAWPTIKDLHGIAEAL